MLDVGCWIFRLCQVLLPDELLHSMILRVGHVKISGRIQRHSPGITEATRFGAGTADDLERLVVGIKYLDPAVAEFTHILSSLGINTNIVGIAQFTFARTRLAVGAQEFAVAGEDLNAMITRVRDINAVLGVNAQSFRTIKLARASTGMAEAIQELNGELCSARGCLLPL